MWRRLLFICACFVLLIFTTVDGHIPDNAPTPPSKVDQYCNMAATCVHDTIPICGKMGEEFRTFLDLCDLLEYACDTSFIFNHIDDQPGCPKIKEKL